jgi:hypothetical protein
MDPASNDRLADLHINEAKNILQWHDKLMRKQNAAPFLGCSILLS